MSDKQPLPTRGGDILPFTPARYDAADPKKPVYLVRVPRLFERQKFWREVASHGVSYPSDAEMDAGLVAAIGRSGLDAERAAAFRELLEEMRAAANEGGDRLKEFAESDDAKLLARVERDVMANDPAYAALAANRAEYLANMDLVAFQLFVDGWSNVIGTNGEPVAYRRAFNKVDEEAMRYLRDADMRAVGNYAISLLQPSKAQEKNSASPRPSQDSPAPSTTTATTTEPPPTDQPG